MSFDHLNLGKDDKVRKILQKHSDEIYDEIILYSNRVTKVNRKSKSQQRILVITNKAMYNFTPGAAKSRSFSIKTLFDSQSQSPPQQTNIPHQDLIKMTNKKGSSRNLNSTLSSPVAVGQMKRRIALKQIHTISLSITVNELVLHVPNEYDYLYRVANKKDIEQIVRVTQETSTNLNHHIRVWQFKLNDLSLISDNNKAHTKKNETQEQYMQRKLQQWQKKYSLKKYTVKKRTTSAATVPTPIRVVTAPQRHAQRASYNFGGGTGGRQGSYFNNNAPQNKHAYFTPPANNNNLQNQQFPALAPLNQQNVIIKNQNQGNQPSLRQVHSDPVYQQAPHGMMYPQGQHGHGRNLTGNMNYPPPPQHVQVQGKGNKKKKRRRKKSESESSSSSDSSSRSHSSSSSRSSSYTGSSSSGSDGSVSDTENGDATPTPTPQQLNVRLQPLRPSNTRLTPKNLTPSPDLHAMNTMNAMNENNIIMNGMNGMNINRFGGGGGRRNNNRHHTSHSAQFTSMNRYPMNKQMPSKALPSTPIKDNMNQANSNNMQNGSGSRNWKRNANNNNNMAQNRNNTNNANNNNNNWNRNMNNNMNVNNTQNNWNRNANNNNNNNWNRNNKNANNKNVNNTQNNWNRNNNNMNKQNGKMNNMNKQNGKMNNMNKQNYNKNANNMNTNGQKSQNANNMNSNQKLGNTNTNIKCVSTILEAKELNVHNKEAYLPDHLFVQVFEMSKQQFYALRPWKQKKLKRNTGFW